MKVTPRLPVHGPYLESPFREMRYFRFGESSLAVALLFGLLEELASLPDIRRLVRSQSKKFETPVKKLVFLTMKGRIDGKSICEAWNSHDAVVCAALTHFRMNPQSLEDMTHALMQFRVQAVYWRGQLAMQAGIVPLYWDVAADQSITLLYSHYGVDSFILASCGHVFVKAELYQTMGMNRCGVDIGTSICAATMADVSTSDAALRSSVEAYIYRGTGIHRFKGGCVLCGSSAEQPACVRGCLICGLCCLRISFTQYGFSCPICRSRFLPAVINMTLNNRKTVIGVTEKETKFLTRCQSCKVYQSMEGFSATFGSDHRCWICDECLLGLEVGSPGSQPCLYCGEEFSSDQLQIIRESQFVAHRPVPSEMAQLTPLPETGELGLECKVCLHQKQPEHFMYFERQIHICQICDECNKAKIFRIPNCPFCDASLQHYGDKDDANRCSGCRMTKFSSDYSIFLSLQHSCKVCNLCVAASVSACQACDKIFSSHDYGIICEKVSELYRESKRCACGNVINRGEYRCDRQCLCSACHLRRIIQSGNTQCPICYSNVPQKSPDHLRCSCCQREANNHKTGNAQITEVCGKGHILCQHCVKVTGIALHCPICHNEVQSSKPAYHFASAQETLIYGCYCAADCPEEPDNLPCGHISHKECKKSLLVCRLCGETLKKGREEVTIWKYAK